MPLNTIRMDIKCEYCSAEAEVKESVIVNHRSEIVTAIKHTCFALPSGWLSMEWQSKAKEGQGYSKAQENVLDSADFCSIECVIKYFQKKRRELIKKAADRGNDL